MPLMRLIYSSRPRIARPLDEFHAACDSILESARRNNSSHGITGVLAACPDLFVQALEGSQEAVSEAFLRISQDDRHHSVCLVEVRPITARRFDRWSMAFAEIEALPADLRAVLMRGPRPDCTGIAPEAILAFLEDAVRHETADLSLVGLGPSRGISPDDDIAFA